MRIRWERIVGFTFIGTFVYLLIKLRPLLVDILKIANEPLNYDSPIKAIMLVALCLTLLVGIKLLLKK
ncbi:MAG: hypothetical protein KAS23_05060 [Anaerohalosphaera sp.]|nr:hypothetical protein [Anaerohalosphaera sp.]